MMKPNKKSSGESNRLERKSRGLRKKDASFPVPPGKGELPENYAAVLGEIKKRIQAEACLDRQFVQEVLAQIPCFHNCVLLDKLNNPQKSV